MIIKILFNEIEKKMPKMKMMMKKKRNETEK